MDLLLVSIRDRAVDAFMRPFPAVTKAAAVRAFSDEINREASSMHGHPEDYDLYLVGLFVERTGALVPAEEGPEMIAVGKEVFKKKSAE